MKDGRLTRTYISMLEVRKPQYRARHSYGIALIPLGDRGRVTSEHYEHEERESLSSYDKYLNNGR
jgi:hypothetical protein